MATISYKQRASCYDSVTTKYSVSEHSGFCLARGSVRASGVNRPGLCSGFCLLGNLEKGSSAPSSLILLHKPAGDKEQDGGRVKGWAQNWAPCHSWLIPRAKQIKWPKPEVRVRETAPVYKEGTSNNEHGESGDVSISRKHSTAAAELLDVSLVSQRVGEVLIVREQNLSGRSEWSRYQFCFP